VNNQNYILPNSAFYNASASACCSCCGGGGGFRCTNFGAWLESGFKGKKKRAAIAANNLNKMATSSGNQNVCTPPVCDATPTVDNTTYAGVGISNKVICKDTANYFGQIPSICDIIGNTTTTTTATGQTVVKAKGTNWLAWGLGVTAVVAASILIYKKFKKSKSAK